MSDVHISNNGMHVVNKNGDEYLVSSGFVFKNHFNTGIVSKHGELHISSINGEVYINGVLYRDNEFNNYGAQLACSPSYRFSGFELNSFMTGVMVGCVLMITSCILGETLRGDLRKD